MTIRISKYQELTKEQIKTMATLLEEKFQQSTETIKVAPTLEDAVINLVSYEAALYDSNNKEKTKIAQTFEDIFKQVGGRI